MLVDNASDEDEVAGFDDVRQFIQEVFFVLTTVEAKAALLLADVGFMQDHEIMAEMFELEGLD